MKQSTPITNLDQLIKNMKPILNKGEYVFVTVMPSELDAIPRHITICEFKEQKGTTMVLLKADAERLNLSYEYIASWITLNIHSSLEAVGLTAAFSTALAQANISCNVIAGYYHDHIFVDVNDGARAMVVLKEIVS